MSSSESQDRADLLPISLPQCQLGGQSDSRTLSTLTDRKSLASEAYSTGKKWVETLPGSLHEVNEQAVSAIGATRQQTPTTMAYFLGTAQNSHHGDRAEGGDDVDTQCHNRGILRASCCHRAHRTRKDLMSITRTVSYDLFSRWQEVFRGFHHISFTHAVLFILNIHSASK